MKKNPNPEVFAKTVLSELARLRGEVFATRLRLYHSLVHSGFPKSFAELSDEDDKNIDKFYQISLKKSLKECGLSPDPTQSDTD